MRFNFSYMLGILKIILMLVALVYIYNMYNQQSRIAKSVYELQDSVYAVGKNNALLNDISVLQQVIANTQSAMIDKNRKEFVEIYNKLIHMESQLNDITDK